MMYPEDNLLRGLTCEEGVCLTAVRTLSTILPTYGSVSTHNSVDNLWITCG
jgi:hypothetical protein